MRGAAFLVAGCLAVVGSALLAAPAAAQTGPVVTADPAAGLHDLQTVQVVGSGFEPGQATTLAQCALREGAVAGVCYGATATPITADGSGNFTTTFLVRRVIREVASTVDCAETAQRCGLSAGALAVAPLTFDPGVPPTEPAISVTPSADLVEGNVVVVHGSGFAHDRDARILQCLTGFVALTGCDVSTSVAVRVDAVGNFVAEFPVVGTITPPAQFGGPVDCRATPENATPCSIVAANTQAPSEFASMPIALLATPGAPPAAPTELPRTGTTRTLGVGTLAIVAAGLALVATARRVRATPSR